MRKNNKTIAQLTPTILIIGLNTDYCLLQQRIVDLERECWANAQYSRRECLEVVGIPANISHDCLEDKVLEIFNNVGCKIKQENIEACHRINKNNDTTIIKFSKRKDCQQVLAVKKDLKT